MFGINDPILIILIEFGILGVVGLFMALIFILTGKQKKDDSKTPLDKQTTK